MTSWLTVVDRLERAAGFPQATIDKAVAAAQAIDEDPDRPGKIDSFWPMADDLPDISQLDFGDAQQQNVAIKSLLGSTKRLNKQKLIDHIKAGAQPIRKNPFTTEPLLTKTDEGLTIVDGHHRLAAMQLLGVKTVKLWTVPATS